MQSHVDVTCGSAFRLHHFGVYLALCAYVLAFASFAPDVLTVSDETAYMRQAFAYAKGQTTVATLDMDSLKEVQALPSDYPPGTSLLMAPLMAAGGWRAGFLLGPLAACLTVLLLANWLSREGRSPLFALLFLTYPAALVMSRCGMSDVPSAALVCLALYFLWFARGRNAWMAAAGFIAGASLLLRETNALVCAIVFLGAVLRRERGWPALLVGGLAGTALRPLAMWLLLGDAFHIKPNLPGWSLSAVAQNAPLHLGALLLLFPGGLIWAGLYRGARRHELLATVVAFVGVYLFYDYNAAASGGLKQWVLASRFFIPLLPLLVIAAAESLTRLHDSRRAYSGGEAKAPPRLAMAAALMLVAGSMGASWLIQWQHGRWSAQQRSLLTAIYAATDSQVPVVTNPDAALRFLNEVYESELGPRLVVSLDEIEADSMARLVARFGRCTVALVGRSDSRRWQEAGAAREDKVERMRERFEVELVTRFSVESGDSVQVWTVYPRR